MPVLPSNSLHPCLQRRRASGSSGSSLPPTLPATGVGMQGTHSTAQQGPGHSTGGRVHALCASTANVVWMCTGLFFFTFEWAQHRAGVRGQHRWEVCPPFMDLGELCASNCASAMAHTHIHTPAHTHTHNTRWRTHTHTHATYSSGLPDQDHPHLGCRHQQRCGTRADAQGCHAITT
jgi:hypothetical protein